MLRRILPSAMHSIGKFLKILLLILTLDFVFYKNSKKECGQPARLFTREDTWPVHIAADADQSSKAPSAFRKR